MRSFTKTLGVLASLFLASTTLAFAQEERIVQLSNGMILGPGILTETGSISSSAFQRGGNTNEGKSIWIMNDHMRKTYFNRAPVNTQLNEEYTGPPLIEIELPNAREVEKSGNDPNVLSVLNISPFNKYGRRTCSVIGNRGRVDFLQGISHLTPKYFKLQTLRTDAEIVWDSRQATATIPAADLKAILFQAKDLNNAADWLDMVAFYRQADRFTEAEEIMSQALDRFRSELADRQPLLTQLRQLASEKRFEEIKLRQEKGQHKLATQFLSAFPKDDLSAEAQLKLAEEINNIKQQLTSIAEVTTALRDHVAQLPAPDQQFVTPVIEELLGELTLSTFPRLNDYNRLRFDDSLAAEDKVSLAVAGWILGPSSGVDNFAVAKSLIRVRSSVEQYLNKSTPQQRQKILSDLRGEEGAQAPILAKLLATMKPPQQPPQQLDSDPPGLYRLEVTTSLGERVKYLVQVPPEYDPNSKYPCILGIPGKGNPPEGEINGWCGQYRKLKFASTRAGYATRYGYIVIAPDWMTEDQVDYNYTEEEQNRILTAMRDAMRKFSIDADRVYCTGHFSGATAAWDLSVSHPDLWAGAVMISPTADKFILHYHDNVRGQSNASVPLATYIVYGEKGGNRNSALGQAASQYVESSFYDSMVVEYIGRGSEAFLEENPRIFEWMELATHRRTKLPTRIETKTMRSGDRFFYWLEAPALLPSVTQNTYQLDPAKAGNFVANYARGQNNIRVSSIPSPKKSAIIWLSPEMVDFTQPITISVSGRGQRYELKPDIGVMLEDARTRADRANVFWQSVMID